MVSESGIDLDSLSIHGRTGFAALVLLGGMMATTTYGLVNAVPELLARGSTFINQAEEQKPAVVALEDGGFALVYQTRPATGQNSQIYF